MQGQINENRQNTWQEISNMGFGLSDFSLSGGFNGLFPKKKPMGMPTIGLPPMYNETEYNQFP